MHRILLSKILFLIFTLVCLALLPVFAQIKPTGEVDVTKCWSYPLADGSGSGIASDGARVFLSYEGGRIDALSLDGQRLWRTEFGWDISSNILPRDEGLFFVTPTPYVDEKGASGGNTLRVLSKETGIPKWFLRLPQASEHFLFSYKDAVVIVSKSGSIRLVDAKTGTVKWSREIAEGFATRPAFNGDEMIVASTTKHVLTVSLATGEIQSMREVQFGVSAVGQNTRGDLVIGDERGNAALFFGAGAKPNWKFKSGGEVSAIFPTEGHVLITSHDNFAYSLSTRNGGVAWKRRLSGRVSQIATIMGRFVLISSFEDHGAVLVDLSSGKVAGQVALGADENLARDPVIYGGTIFILTNRAVYEFSLTGCTDKKESGADNMPAAASLK